MTPEQIEYHYLSLRVWLLRVVGPAAAVLITALLLCQGLLRPERRDHIAVLIGFAALYYVLIRGGHIVMIRSLHRDLLRRYETEYRERLLGLTGRKIRRNIGFTLTRIKRDILDSQR